MSLLVAKKSDNWNWSDKEHKWVRDEIVEGKKKYYYREDPPKLFMELNSKINKINKKLIESTDVKENLKYFKKLMKISQKMQSMRANDL